MKQLAKLALIHELSIQHSDLSIRQVEMGLEEILKTLTDALERGERIEIRQFGCWDVRYHPPRKGRNPKKGTTVNVPGKYVPYFKAGKELRERVNGATS